MGARFLEVHFSVGCLWVFLRNVCPRQMNVQFSDDVMIELESLILAQNERWRQA